MAETCCSWKHNVIKDVLWEQWLEVYISLWHNGDVSSKKSAANSQVGFTDG